MSDKLTARQEKFVLNLYQGMTQREAYTRAGYSDKAQESTIDELACRLAADDKVATRLTELRNLVALDTVMTVGERKERLTELAKLPVKASPTVKETTLAIAELNKMDGSYAPSKQAIIGEITLRIVHDTDRVEEPETGYPRESVPDEV